MPSKQVRIKNNWHLDYKETIHGKEYAIPAGQTIELPRYEGVGLMGSCIGYVKWEGDPKDYPYAKALVMEDIPESGEMNIKDFIHPKQGTNILRKRLLMLLCEGTMINHWCRN